MSKFFDTKDDSYDIDHLWYLISARSKLTIFDSLQWSEVELHMDRFFIIQAFLDVSISVKSDAVIILDSRIPLVGYLDLATSHDISLAILNDLIKLFGRFLKESSLDHTTLRIHEINI